MDLPKPATGNEFVYSRQVARASLPSGACQHWDKIRMPHPKPRQRACELILNLETGELGGTNGVEAAIDLVGQLLKAGRKTEAMQVMNLVKQKMGE